MTEPPATDLYPEGRMFYYEGDDPCAFIKAMQALKLEPSVSVQVPPELLDQIQSSWPVGT